MASLYEEWKAAKRQYETCQGAVISNSFRKLDYTYKALIGNTADLKKFFDHCESNEGQIHVHLVFFDQEGRDDVLIELYRHLLNYSASAMALVDHTRNVYTKLLKESHYWEEYEKKVKSDLSCKGHMQFIQKLRNYFLHYQSSGTNYSLGSKDGKTNTPFYLESETLLRWD